MPSSILLGFGQSGLLALFCIVFIVVGVAHIVFPRLAKAFWLLYFFPVGATRDYEESPIGYQLIGGFFILIAGVVGYYAWRAGFF